MDKSYLLEKYILNESRLIEYGFTLNKEKYVYKYMLKELDFYAYFFIQNNKFEIKVYDLETEEAYILFSIKDASGKTVTAIREEVWDVTNDILDKCFSKYDLKEQLLEYASEVYDKAPETPFKKLPTYYVMKTSRKNKWYAVFIDITYDKLGVKCKDTIHIVNVKNHPEKIKNLIDYKQFFPAYHMNKKYWITVVLNKSTDVGLLKSLIDESYSIIENKV